ncbi:MAG: hypothetical protein ACYC1D_18025 [Acidimicrobiales bacterium]
MRSHLILQLISVVVLMVLTVLGVRAWASSSSVLNPSNVARNGLAGICANEQAVAAAGGSAAGGSAAGGSAAGGSAAGVGGPATGTPGTAVSPSIRSQLQVSDPAGLRALERATGGRLTCTTTTTSAP